MREEAPVVTQLAWSSGSTEASQEMAASLLGIVPLQWRVPFVKAARSSQPCVIFHLRNSVLDDSLLFFIK
jgi:hypothetical protein